MRCVRFPENPVVSPSDVVPTREDFEIIGTFNAGATRFGEEILLLVRVAERPIQEEGWVSVPVLKVGHDPAEYEVRRFRTDDPDLDTTDPRVFEHRGNCYLSSISHLRLARSRDGRHFEVGSRPTVMPEGKHEEFGIEDPRVTRISDTYWVSHSAVSSHGVSTALLSTRDFNRFERHGVIFPPDNKDIAIFPEKVGENYVTFHRPGSSLGSLPSVWLSYSRDLVRWGNHQFLMAPREGKWDDGRVGCGSPPILTDRGWLEIYHGATKDNRYCLGSLLLDAQDPLRILARSSEPIVEPEAKYEIDGFFGNVVFACGHIEFEDGRLFLYYGAADTSVCGLETTVSDVLATLE